MPFVRVFVLNLAHTYTHAVPMEAFLFIRVQNLCWAFIDYKLFSWKKFGEGLCLEYSRYFEFGGREYGFVSLLFCG